MDGTEGGKRRMHMLKLPGGVGTGRNYVQGEHSVGPKTYCSPTETAAGPIKTGQSGNGSVSAPLGKPLRLGDDKARYS
jgi:hypothetical protein